MMSHFYKHIDAFYRNFIMHRNVLYFSALLHSSKHKPYKLNAIPTQKVPSKYSAQVFKGNTALQTVRAVTDRCVKDTSFVIQQYNKGLAVPCIWWRLLHCDVMLTDVDSVSP